MYTGLISAHQMEQICKRLHNTAAACGMLDNYHGAVRLAYPDVHDIATVIENMSAHKLYEVIALVRIMVPGTSKLIKECRWITPYVVHCLKEARNARLCAALTEVARSCGGQTIVAATAVESAVDSVRDNVPEETTADAVATSKTCDFDAWFEENKQAINDWSEEYDNASVGCYLSAHGLLDLLKQYLVMSHEPSNKSMINYAAKNDHLETVKFLHDHGIGAGDVLHIAADNGHLDIVKWAYNYTELRGYAVNMAAHNGHLNVLVWLCEQGCQVNSLTFKYALNGGYLGILKYLHTLKCDYHSTSSLVPVKNNRLDIIKWLVEEKYVLDDTIIDVAFKSGNLAIAQYLIDIGRPIFPSTIAAAKTAGYALKTGLVKVDSDGNVVI